MPMELYSSTQAGELEVRGTIDHGGGPRRVRPPLILRLVVAGFTAGFAVVEAVFAKADGVLSHANVAVAIAFAALFGHFAGGTTEFGLARIHDETLARPGGGEKFHW